MNRETNVVLRAFELARDGQCKTITEIKQKLVREGYDGAHQHLSSRSLSKQLRQLIHIDDPKIGASISQEVAKPRPLSRKTLTLFIPADR